ncbi:MAG: terpene cyclase/mutase family protein, partial [Planctomycetota bacterium]|nr:terpene cyclase/mutase family protein [Planctomycetota bacterium]
MFGILRFCLRGPRVGSEARHSAPWQMRSVVIFALVVLCGIAPGSRSEEKKEAPPAAARNPKVEEAVKKGVAFLLSQQKPDGAIHTGNNPTAMTALALLAMAAVGHLPGDEGAEGEAARKALEFLLRDDRQNAEGYFGIDGSRMYGHGIVTLLLAELYGMGKTPHDDSRLRDRLEKALALCLRAQAVPKDQNHAGGWRYEPGSNDSDLSVTIWHLLALRAARNAGLPVAKEAIDRAVAYLKRTYHSPRDAEGKPTNLKSGCAYQPGNGPTYQSAAAGLLAMQLCGEYEALEVIGAADFLREIKIDPNQDFFYYGSYYFSQGMYQRGGEYAS